MKPKILKPGKNILLLTLIVCLLVWTAHQIGFLENFELKSFDSRLKLRGPLPLVDSSLVIVTLDDQTFSSLPIQWPYPRSIYAQLIRNLKSAGARLIVFDLEFTEPTPDDKILGMAAAEAGNVIFAGKLVTEIGAHNTINQYVLEPVSALLQKGTSWALVNIVEDNDGFLRRYFLAKHVADHRYLSLGLEVMRRWLHLPETSLREDSNNFWLGDFPIPKYTPETMLINFAGPAHTFPTYSLVNILDDFEFDIGDEDTDIFEMYKIWGTFRNKIVLIGCSAEELQDTKFTPFFEYEGNKRKMPGVEVHANAIYTIFQRMFLIPVDTKITVALIVLLSLLVGILTQLARPLKAGIGVLLILALFLIGNFAIFIQKNLILPITPPVLAIVFTYLGHTAVLFVSEQREKLRYRKIFQQYVSKNVVERMLDSGEYPRFGGERKKLTVLFSDIRGFTTFSEKYPPEEVVARLSEYLTEMADITIQHDGTLDKFVGDEIMAIYGAPYYYQNHAEKACRTAQAMINRLRELQREYAAKNGSYFNIGIGINTGEMVVGNLGSRQLFDYTVIGDAVNLGARLEGINKFYKTNIILSEFTYQEVKDIAIVRELDFIKVKGKTRPIKIYELRGMDNIPQFEYELLVQVYQQALQFYQQGEWYRALVEFRRVLHYFPTDGPSRLYVRRCLDLMENPPAEDWEPVFVFETK